MGERYFEIDAIRGVALLLMVLYHTLFCLNLFRILPWFDPHTFSGAPIAAMFIAVAGLSLVLSRRTPSALIKRGLYILVFAAIVTLVTFVVYPKAFVVFGVLHMIGVGTILAIPFVNRKWYVPLAGAAVILLLTPWIQSLSGSAFLLPFGVMPAGFASIDYEPLFPWFGVMLFGVAAGKILYPAGKRGAWGSRMPAMPKALAPLCFFGRHTLFIYMVHVPIIIAVVAVVFGVDLGAFF